MELDTKILDGVFTIIKRSQDENDADRELVEDLLTFCQYGHDVLSQFSMGLCGYTFRHNHANVLMTVKVLEGNTPLVAFVTSQTTTGCVTKFLDLLFQSKLKWQRDKFPWI